MSEWEECVRVGAQMGKSFEPYLIQDIDPALDGTVGFSSTSTKPYPGKTPACTVSCRTGVSHLMIL